MLVTTGSQAADLSAGSMTEAPGAPRNTGRSWALWKRFAAGAEGIRQSGHILRRGPRDRRFALGDVHGHRRRGTNSSSGSPSCTRQRAGRGGLLTLKDSGWVMSLSVFHQPEVIGQPSGHERLVGLRALSRTQRQFRQETHGSMHRRGNPEEMLRHLRFDEQLDAIMESSICVPCNMPYVNNIWLRAAAATGRPWFRRGRPISDSSASTSSLRRKSRSLSNTPSARRGRRFTACSKRGPAPPPVYQGQYDPKGVWAALTVFLGLTRLGGLHRTTFRRRTRVRSAMSDAAHVRTPRRPWKPGPSNAMKPAASKAWRGRRADVGS